jgi:hypothetical protein
VEVDPGVRGLHNAYHVPGAGVVLLDAARILIDLETFEPLFEAGPHEYFDRRTKRSRKSPPHEPDLDAV